MTSVLTSIVVFAAVAFLGVLIVGVGLALYSWFSTPADGPLVCPSCGVHHCNDGPDAPCCSPDCAEDERDWAEYNSRHTFYP